MNYLLYIGILLYMFLSVTVATHIGIKQVGTFSSSIIILLFLLKFIGDINHQLLKKYKTEFHILLCGVFIIFFKLFIGQAEQINQVLFFVMVPMMFSVVLGTQNKLNLKIIRNLILFFFVAECFLAIYERVFFTNVFPYIEDMDEIIFENWSFRSTAFLGHPLANTLSVSTIMGFVVASSMKNINKLLFMILGLIALLCFNARAALLIWSVLIVLFLYQVLKDKKTKIGGIISILFFTILSAYFLYSAILDYGLGGRLLNEKINDGSAQTRIQVFDAFSYINNIDFWCGNAANYIPVMHKLGAAGVENSYIVLIINYGAPLFIVLFILYFILIKRLLKKHLLFNKLIIISSFILVGSTNNGLAVSTPWGFFILCAYSFPFLEKVRNENQYPFRNRMTMERGDLALDKYNPLSNNVLEIFQIIMSQIPIIAILLTCHNRKAKTMQCLENLYVQKGLNIDFKLDVFLVDDGSTDGTSEAINSQFPLIHIIQGNGNLYWNQGMRLAWKSAAVTKEFDYYLWLNDDTILDSNALVNLIETYNRATVFEQKEAIITAACRTALGNNIFSYGGRDESGPVVPNGNLQRCKYINGNAVLVSKVIYKELGNLSNVYTHGMGDFDYGLRALKAGFRCYTTKNYIATCPPNEGIPGWCNPNLPLKKRWELFHSPRGLNISEYIKFRKKFWGIQWISFAIKAYVKMISPTFYQKIS